MKDTEYENDLWHVKYEVSFKKDTQLKLKQITQHND